jgi:hypothetical protein
MSAPAQPSLEKLARIEVRVSPPLQLGALAGSERRMVPILGGMMWIYGLEGTILPGGSDIQRVAADGKIELVARYAIDFGAAGKLLVENTGIRREALEAPAPGIEPMPYFRGIIRFDAPSGVLEKLNQSIFLSTGHREGGTVSLDVFEVK